MASMIRTRKRAMVPAAAMWPSWTDEFRVELVDDFPAVKTPRATSPAPRTQSGCRLAPAEEAALFGLTPVDPEGVRYGIEASAPIDDDGPELPDVGPDGYSAEYDDYSRYQAQMDRWIAGRGPRPV